MMSIFSKYPLFFVINYFIITYSSPCSKKIVADNNDSLCEVVLTNYDEIRSFLQSGIFLRTFLVL